MTPAPAAMPIIAPNERLKGVEVVVDDDDDRTAPTERDGDGEREAPTEVDGVGDNDGDGDADGHAGVVILNGLPIADALNIESPDVTGTLPNELGTRDAKI